VVGVTRRLYRRLSLGNVVLRRSLGIRFECHAEMYEIHAAVQELRGKTVVALEINFSHAAQTIEGGGLLLT
jgi:hypothetical protein